MLKISYTKNSVCDVMHLAVSQHNIS